ncbi:MT-A70 family methyltransferase [Celeribacter sp.]|uniref:MT-A70 family methyltransferase n=1 Tax=Celeribacter sp. TaxID=1890673 RepID=UPI003A8DE700
MNAPLAELALEREMARIAQEWAQMRPFGGYTLIKADPPWKMATWSKKGETKKSALGQYKCQPEEWISAMPLDALAADNCLLWLWATNPMLPHALRVMDAWGFEFKTAGHWSKRTTHGKLAFGTGYILRCAGEPFLIGTRGKVKTARNVRSVIDAKATGHSRKPAEAFLEAERLMPHARRIELFSRKSRENWSVWGDETGKFDHEN